MQEICVAMDIRLNVKMFAYIIAEMHRIFRILC